MTESANENADILIVGAGPVGMTLHLALAAGGQSSLLLDRRPPAALQADPRALALSHGARELLEQIDSWPTRAATPIETIHVSQKDGFGRTLIDRADYALPALGYVVRYRDLAAALAALGFIEAAVIILTGHGNETDRETCMQLGAFAYLNKPVDIDVLSETMKKANDKIMANRQQKRA